MLEYVKSEKLAVVLSEKESQAHISVCNFVQEMRQSTEHRPRKNIIPSKILVFLQ